MKTKKCSGKFVIRISQDLHADLKAQAVDRDISLNELCQNKLELKAGGVNGLVNMLQLFFKHPIFGVYQMGSTVRGDNTESSDIDFLVIIDSNQLINRELYKKWDEYSIEQKMENKISVHFVHLPNKLTHISSLWLEVALEGFSLYDPQFKVHRLLILIRKQILEQKYRRTYSHGQPVWIKNLETDHAK